MNQSPSRLQRLSTALQLTHHTPSNALSLLLAILTLLTSYLMSDEATFRPLLITLSATTLFFVTLLWRRCFLTFSDRSRAPQLPLSDLITALALHTVLDLALLSSCMTLLLTLSHIVQAFRP